MIVDVMSFDYRINASNDYLVLIEIQKKLSSRKILAIAARFLGNVFAVKGDVE